MPWIKTMWSSMEEHSSAVVANKTEVTHSGHTVLTHTLSPGGESNHDSCYDSDGSPNISRRNSTLALSGGHDAVSRTTSETLAEELVESDDSKNTNSSKKDSSGPCTAKVEYALKLGYTETQIKAAIKELGSNVDNDTLLSQLIKANFEETNSVLAQEFDSSCSVASDITTSSDQTSHTVVQRPAKDKKPAQSSTFLRPIVLDGSNVAMHHGNKEVFSCQGLRLAVEWFQQNGHEDITIFVPTWRKEQNPGDNNITDQHVLFELEKENILKFTPSRQVGGKRIVSHDDRYILKLAAENCGIVVSNDNYRDLLPEQEFQDVIEHRILMYTFVQNRFMPPDDPLGRRGPSLAQFLRFPNVLQPGEGGPPICPYGKKCTYGNKCKFSHPERGPQAYRSVTDDLRKQSNARIMASRKEGLLSSAGDGGIMKKPLDKSASVGSYVGSSVPQKKQLTRTKSVNPTVVVAPPGSSNHANPSVLVTEASHSRGERHGASPRGIRGQPGLLQPPGLLKGAHEPLRPVRSDPTAAFLKGAGGSHAGMMRARSGDLLGDSRCGASAERDANTHKKLERQLSLKGAEDPRLSKGKPTFHFHNPSYPAYGGLQGGPWPQPGLVGVQPGMFVVPPPPLGPMGLHRQVLQRSLGPTLMVPEPHMPVGRMASAPESYKPNEPQNHGRGEAPRAIQRNNSSSDSNLHVLGDSQHGDPSAGAAFGQQSIWSFPGSFMQAPPMQAQAAREYQLFGNPATVGLGGAAEQEEPPKTGRITPGACRPGSSEQLSLEALQRQLEHQKRLIENLQENMSRSTENLPTGGSSATAAGGAYPPNPAEVAQAQQARSQLYYHLCHLFPEDKVRGVMTTYPQETDPKVLCAILLNHP